ncbi:MAG: saccharopine dehydrogenase, partial [Sphingobacteriales bacterium]
MNILVFGAGRSAYFTIQYLLANAQKHAWQVTVADSEIKNIEVCTQGFDNAVSKITDVNNKEERLSLLQN